MAELVDVFADDYEPPKPEAPAKQGGLVDVFAPDYEKPTVTGEFVKGVKSGISATKEGLYGLAALGGNVIGSKVAEDWGREGAARAQAEQQAVAPVVGRVEDIGSVSDAALWASQGLGQLAPFMAASAVSAGLGGAAGGALAGGAAVGRVAGVAPSVARAAAAASKAAAQRVGANIGAGVTSIGQEVGSIAADQAEQGAIEPGKAIAHGVPAGLLDVLPQSRIIGKVLGKADAVRPGFVRDIGAQTALEGGTEAAQTALERSGANREVLSAEGASEMLNAAALGAVGGGVVGGLGRAAEGVLGPRQERIIAPPEPRPDPLALPAPGQTTLPMGEGGPATPEQQAAAEAADTHAADVLAQRAAYEAEQAKLAIERTQRALNPLSTAAGIAGLLPAPGAAGAPPSDIGADAGVFPLSQQHAQQGAADHAAAVYAARDAKAAELARFAAQGTLSTAAATAMGSGVAAQAQAQRQAAADEATRPQVANAIPEPVSAEEKEAGAGVAEQLSRARPMGLAQAQARVASSAGRQELTVVPLPGNAGYAVVASSKLSNRQRTALKGLQAPSDAPVNEAATRMPLATPEAAAARAGRLAMETGREWEVVPHPMARDKFAVRPKQAEQPATQPAASTQRGQPAPAVQQPAVFTNREQPQEVNGGAQEAAAAQRPSEGVADNPADAAGAGVGAQAAGPAVAQAPAQVNQEAIPAASAETPYAEITRLVSDAATSPTNDRDHPTSKQALAGNYKKVRIPPALVDGLPVTVENPAGSIRVAPDGSWASAMPHHYGYIRRTEGNDGDKVDIAIGPGKGVFVVNQLDPKTGEFDEHKVMYGFDTQEAAEAAYRAAYPADWKGFGSIVPTTADALKAWLAQGPTTSPFGKRETGPKLDKDSLAGVIVRTPVQIEETGEVVYEERDAKEALVEARSRARKFEALLRCLRT